MSRLKRIRNLSKHTTVVNSIFSLLLQATTIISGLILPRLIISTLGSDVNGLVTSLSQFLNFVTLFEGGIGAVIMANLYRPLAERNTEQISSTVKTTRQFYQKISYIFIAYAIGVALIYPLIVRSNFTYGYIASLALILAVSIFVQYNLSLSLKLLLNADKKVALTSLIQIIVVTLNTTATALILNIFPNIHVVKIATATIYLLQPILYSAFVKKYYSLNHHIKPDKALLKNRWSGFGINLASFIHYNTDVIVLTLFTNLDIVSVYSVYALVTTGLRQIIQAISRGIIPSLGNAYASKNTKNLYKIFDKYETVTFLLTFLLFAVGALLITPFVALYTHGVTDANYYQPLLGVLLILAEGVCCLREPYVNMAYSANRFKDVTKHAILEAALNIVISVALVFKFGVIGVAIGTLISMLYRTTFHVWYTKKIIPKWKYSNFFKRVIANSVAAIASIGLCLMLLPPDNKGWASWIIHGIIYTIIVGCLVLCANIITKKGEYAE